MLGVKGYSSVQLRTQTRTDMTKIKVTKAKTSGVAKIVKNIKKLTIKSPKSSRMC